MKRTIIAILSAAALLSPLACSQNCPVEPAQAPTADACACEVPAAPEAKAPEAPKDSADAQPDKARIVLENIAQRKSVRTYTSDPVSKDQLETILRAGMAAPTAMNKQPWVFVVLSERASLDALAEKLPRGKMIGSAQAAIVVCGDMDKAIEGEAREFWVQDASAATQNILLAAEALGLGAVWTGAYPSQERVKSIQEALALPENIVPLNVIPIGHPEGENLPKDKWKPENIHWEKW